jgi:hypothetical protein
VNPSPSPKPVECFQAGGPESAGMWTMWTGCVPRRQAGFRAENAYVCKLGWVCRESLREGLSDENDLGRHIGCTVKSGCQAEREARGERVLGSVGWERPRVWRGMIQSDDDRSVGYEAMQLTCSSLAFLFLCPIYHPRLCRFSESPHLLPPLVFLIFSSSSSLFFLLLSLTLFF